MATLNVSLPDQLRDWVSSQVKAGIYSSASDYMRDLIRSDKRQKEQDWKSLSDHLQPLVNTPDDQFVTVSATDVKARMRQKLEGQR